MVQYLLEILGRPEYLFGGPPMIHKMAIASANHNYDSSENPRRSLIPSIGSRRQFGIVKDGALVRKHFIEVLDDEEANFLQI